MPGVVERAVSVPSACSPCTTLAARRGHSPSPARRVRALFCVVGSIELLYSLVLCGVVGRVEKVRILEDLAMVRRTMLALTVVAVAAYRPAVLPQRTAPVSRTAPITMINLFGNNGVHACESATQPQRGAAACAGAHRREQLLSACARAKSAALRAGARRPSSDARRARCCPQTRASSAAQL